MISYLYKGIKSNDFLLFEEVLKCEDVLDQLHKAVAQFLLKGISRENLTGTSRPQIHLLLSMTRDIERIGDHAENIVELFQTKDDLNADFSEPAWEALDRTFKIVISMIEKLVIGIDSPDKTVRDQLKLLEKEFKIIEEEEIHRHGLRFADSTCSVPGGVIFGDLFDNLYSVVRHIRDAGKAVRVFAETMKTP